MLKNEVIDIIRGAISEDMDGFGDITSKYLIPPAKNSFSYIVCKEESGAILSGLDMAGFVLEEIDRNIKIDKLKNDGDRLEYMDRVCNITGSTLSILKAERICLNFIQHMSGIATLTSKFAKIAEPYKVKIVDTRKTKPILRKIEKYAVLCGGGYNHRFGLFDGILIKDNHIAAAGGVSRAIESIRANVPHTLKIEVEIKDFNQLDEAITSRADIIMLDNMDTDQMARAVKIIREKRSSSCSVEASGNINLENFEEICKTGVDIISVGLITHSAPAIDFSLEFEKSI
ncbi:MAG: nicotinate-nucleotide diphosphorylase (carboxylating) [Candidatus Hydromicrobium americanum]|nr:MAG: nicotinate-nucleotide diphosphorylase (carboxylating) [Candidatus Hydromicrobium americanum]